MGYRCPIHRSAGIPGINPNAKVPVILDGSLVLWESNTICRYLAGKHGRSDLLPADPAARAGSAVDRLAGDGARQRLARRLQALARTSQAHVDPQAIAASVADWNRQMQILDAQLERTGA